MSSEIIHKVIAGLASDLSRLGLAVGKLVEGWENSAIDGSTIIEKSTSDTLNASKMPFLSSNLDVSVVECCWIGLDQKWGAC